MVFSSLFFLFFFLPLVLLCYRLAPPHRRNGIALAASLFFYAWGAPRFVFVLAGGSVFDYVVSRAIGPPGRSVRQRRRRLFLALAIAMNLGLLLYFKYANFAVMELNRFLGGLGYEDIGWTAVALPIGISFFTFQKLSYLIDVYRGVVAPARSLPTYMLYVSLFPQLIAGPIVRYHDVARQLESRAATADRMFEGIWRFSRGLGRKVLIANVLGEAANHAFALGPDRLSTAEAWVGVVCYSFQLYFDFAGYSDMAIGLGRMLGFEFLENFNCPYIARSFTEFWRRWHISLSNWMREYLYIPLGGNRRGPARTYLNLWIVFVLSGLWHGASWNFIVWGMYHGLFLSLDKLAGRDRQDRIPRLVSIPATFLLVTIGWVFFRANDIGHAWFYLGRMFPVAAGARAVETAPWSRLLDAQRAWTLGAAVFFSFAPAWQGAWTALRRWLGTDTRVGPVLAFASSVLLVILSASALAAGKFNPFIYFRF